MTTKIAIITTKYLKEYMEKNFSKIQSDCEFTVHEYTNFKNISQIYTDLENEVDGFIVTGNIAQYVIEKTVKKLKKPIVWLGIDLLNLYRIFLNLLIEDRSLDISRVIVDFFIPLREYPNWFEILKDENVDLIKTEMEKWIQKSSLENFHNLEEDITERIIYLWDHKKIDFVVCAYSSIMPTLEKKGIPSIFSYPSLNQIKETTNSLLSIIRDNQMRENLPVIISVSKERKTSNEELDLDTISLQKSLLEFNKIKMTDFLVQKKSEGFDIYTSLKVTNHITHFLENCQLSLYLEEHLDFKVVIGYGIGNNISEAKSNAEEAKKEAALVGGSFAMDEKHNLIGPFNTEHILTITNEITPEIQRVAQDARLSTLTIQKLISILKILGTDQLTTQDLAAKLNATVRNANRILSNLEKNGYAKILYSKSSGTKGRPIKVYQITIPFKGD